MACMYLQVIVIVTVQSFEQMLLLTKAALHYQERLAKHAAVEGVHRRIRQYILFGIVNLLA